jgi:hypothetical protein
LNFPAAAGQLKISSHRLTPLFTSDCWFTVELLVKVLKPFYAAAKAISGNDYPTIGITFFILRRLEKDYLLNTLNGEDTT